MPDLETNAAYYTSLLNCTQTSVLILQTQTCTHFTKYPQLLISKTHLSTQATFHIVLVVLQGNHYHE